MALSVEARESLDALRKPRNVVERLVWLHGRKFYLAFFAGSSIFLVAVIGIWVVARVNDARGELVLDIIKYYFAAAAGIVTLYTGGNTLVERAYAKLPDALAAPTTAPPPPAARASGVVHPLADGDHP